MAKVVFEENQKFDQWWLRALLLLVLVIMIRMLLRILDSGELDQTGILAIFLGVLPVLILSGLFFFVEMKTRIDEDGIHASFYPFRFSKKTIKWSEMKDALLVTYSPLRDYGGWGYRISVKNGKAMNVKGNRGIKIFLQNGKQFLIGTQRPDEAERIINDFFNPNK